MMKKSIFLSGVLACVIGLTAGPVSAQGVLFVANDMVGIGEENPQAPLHVEADGGGNLIDMVRLENNGAPQFRYVDTSNGNVWRIGPNPSGHFVMNEVADLAIAELRVSPAGGVFVNGTQLNVPDYVFGSDYELMPLADLERFIKDEGHLPNVPNADQIRKTGLNLAKMPLHLLEKVEELTLYTLEQERGLTELRAENSMLRERLAALEAAVSRQ